MSKRAIFILTITVLFMIIGGKSTYGKLIFKEVDVKENVDNTDMDLVMNESNIEKNKTHNYENTKKAPSKSSDEIDMESELREMTLNYHTIDTRLGKPLNEPQIISYWKINDTQYTVKTSGYYNFGFEVWEPIDYTFSVEKNSNGDFVIKSWNGIVFDSKTSHGMELKSFFDMEEAFKKDSNYSAIYKLLSENARKYYVGVGRMHIIHYKKISDTQYEVGIIDKFDYGVSTPVWESRTFLVQKNDSGQWNEIGMHGTILSDWNKFIYSNNSRKYVAKSLYEQGKFMGDFKFEKFKKVSNDKIIAIVSFDEVISNDTNGTSESRKMAEVYLEQNGDGEWIALSMKEVD